VKALLQFVVNAHLETFLVTVRNASGKGAAAP
jgi:hypothetical protein